MKPTKEITKKMESVRTQGRTKDKGKEEQKKYRAA